MATRLIGRKYATTISDSLEGESTSGTYEVIYVVGVDSCTDESEVLSTAGLPALGDESTVYPETFCVSRSATEVEGDYWEVTVSYSSAGPSSGSGPGGGGGKSGSNPDGSGDNPDYEQPPWEQGGEYTVQTATMSEYAASMFFCGTDPYVVPGQSMPRWNKLDEIDVGNPFGYKKKRVQNAIGEPIHYDTQIQYVQFKYKRAKYSFDFEDVWKYVGCVNEKEVTICNIKFPPYSVRIEDLQADNRKWKTFNYWELSFTASCTDRPQGWKTEFANIGTYYATDGDFSANQPIPPLANAPMVNDAGDPIIGPLDEFGSPKAANNPDVWLYWLEYEPKDLELFFRKFF